LTAIIWFSNMEKTLQNALISFLSLYIFGFPLLALGCSLFAGIGKWILSGRAKEQ